MQKDAKLGIITNVGKRRLVKVIFANIQKMSDAYANSFGRCMIYEKCFYFLLNSSFLGKMVFLGKLKLIPSAPPLPLALQKLFSPHLFNFIQKMFGLIPI